jgi:dolichol kinase
MNVFRQEAFRKLFHLFSALYALLYVVSGRRATLWILGAGTLAVAALEALRLRRPEFNRMLLERFGGIHRDKEIDRPSGILWTLLGCFGLVWVVPEKDIVVASMLYLTVGDGLAGFVGRNWGRLRVGRKSAEGSLACSTT